MGKKHGLNFEDPDEAHKLIEQELLKEACITLKDQVRQIKESKASMVRRYRIKHEANAKMMQAMIYDLEAKNREIER